MKAGVNQAPGQDEKENAFFKYPERQDVPGGAVQRHDDRPAEGPQDEKRDEFPFTGREQAPKRIPFKCRRRRQ